MRNYEYLSPLRYPGGKSSLTQPLADIIERNHLYNCRFYEVFAGGGGASLNLLFRNTVAEIFINDVDYHIYAFWHSVLNETDSLIAKIREVEISIEEWYRQKGIYDKPEGQTDLDIGFATLFLNRTNRSGVLSSAGPIGGYEQIGKYKIGARFYKATIIKRIEAIAQRKDSIQISNHDALKVLEDLAQENVDGVPSLFFLDPPYYNNGARLYLNYYLTEDHQQLANMLNQHNDLYWLTTYDNAEDIRAMYQERRVFEFHLNYQMNGPKRGKELMIVSDSIGLPETEWLLCT